jgi:hypothetical protein
MIVLTIVVQQHLGCSDDEPAKSTAFLQRKRAIISVASQIYGCFSELVCIHVVSSMISG